MFAADPKVITAAAGAVLRGVADPSWKQIIEPVDSFLDAVGRRLGEQVHAFDEALLPYADYVLRAQGKNLRPALVALTADALGKPSDDHVTVAVVIEMVHLATLVHDDVMDEAEMRRGRLTMSANWGNDLAVLLGDCLFARALTLAASFPVPDICRAVAMATNTVCSGEILQTQHQGEFISRELYFKMLRMKTAELFALSCELAAFLAKAPPPWQQALRKFGLSFGTAYQIYDDCLDLFGSEAAAGKSLGTDLAKGKLTLPVLLLWERAQPREREHLRSLMRPWHPDAMEALSKYLKDYDTLALALEIMREHLRAAASALESLPAAMGRDGLLSLTRFLARQTDALGLGVEGSL